MIDISSYSRQQIRDLMRIKRQSLSEFAQQQAAQSIIPPALSLIEQYHAQHIACYLSFNGEISPLALMDTLIEQGKSVYLPVLHPFSRGNLLFLRYDPERLKPNRYGILEPELDVRAILPLKELDLIFVPLVACDRQNNRLGMGGGYYDRTLPQTRAVSVGLAHQCQMVNLLPTESWDQALDYLIVGE